MPAKRPVTKVPPAKMSTMRFRPEDVQLIERLRADTGIDSLTELLRLALRALSRERGLQ